VRKVKYYVATTVDGFIASEEHAFDMFVNEGDHVTEYLAAVATYGVVLMGRRTYEVGLKFGVTDPYPHAETYVFSRSMKESPNPRVKVIAENAVDVVRRLKEEDGKDIYLCGGGELASALFQENLVDEVIVKLNPLILGAGISMTSGLGGIQRLDLLSTKVYRNGVVLLQYAVKRP